MNRITFIIVLVLLTLSSCSSVGSQKVTYNYSLNTYVANLEMRLGHELNTTELVKAKATYEYYSLKFKNNWTREYWTEATTNGLAIQKNQKTLDEIKTKDRLKQ